MKGIVLGAVAQLTNDQIEQIADNSKDLSYDVRFRVLERLASIISAIAAKQVHD